MATASISTDEPSHAISVDSMERAAIQSSSISYSTSYGRQIFGRNNLGNALPSSCSDIGSEQSRAEGIHKDDFIVAMIRTASGNTFYKFANRYSLPASASGDGLRIDTYHILTCRRLGKADSSSI